MTIPPDELRGLPAARDVNRKDIESAVAARREAETAQRFARAAMPK